MSVLNNKINAPVGVGDVKQILGEPSNDVGTLCMSNNINKWSKHKPVRSETISPDYSDKTEWERHFYTYDVSERPNRFYGMDVTISNDGNDRADDLYDERYCQNWEYARPLGGSRSPYRLGDFEGYFHLASQFCQSNFGKDITEEYIVSNDSDSYDGVMFYCDGIHNNSGGVSFSDFKNLKSGNFVLCANVYNHDTGAYIAEYINDSIRLFESTSTTTLNPDYDDGADRYKYVTVNFDKQHYWGKTVDVYLTLDWVKYYSSDRQWVTESKMIIPFDDNHYYKKTIKFTVLNRQVQAYELQTGYNSNAGAMTWSKMFTPVPSTYPDLFLSPFLHFKISRTRTPLRFYTGQNHQGYWIRTKFIKPDGTKLTRDGETTTATKTNIPSYIDIQSASTTSDFSKMDDLYIQVNNIFGETDISKFQKMLSYPIEVYLCHGTDETKVGTFSLSWT